MDISRQYSDPDLSSLWSWTDKVETSSSSDAGTSSRRPAHSDEEVFLLAASRPKKRAGRRVFKETRHPVFRGIRRRNKDKWVCELREPNKKTRIWLGTYPTPEMAARAHDVAALALRGKAACLNFADSAWTLPVPASKNAADIRKAAAEAAEAFRPQEFEETPYSVKASDGEVSSYDCNSGQKFLAEDVFSPQITQFLDEEAVFNMPGLLANMAEGLLLSPPPPYWSGANSGDAESDIDISLWSYSV